ncbi:MAG: hypothetical protein VR67_14560 [Peptococcaceae bacterium BRH_c8a]|nr:MAG: hypothetical protein VR67_14560 [Peptococcaceae bacterium BRH_c8a]
MDVQDLKFRVYFLVVVLAGLLILLISLINIDLNMWYVYIFWILVFMIIDIRPISLDIKGQVSLSFALSLALLLIHGTWFCIVVSSVGSVLTDILGKRGWQKNIFNCSQYSISIFAAGTIYSKLSPQTKEIFVINEHIIPFVFTAFTDIVFNFLLVAIIVALSYKIPLFSVIKKDLGMVALFLFSLAPMSLLIVVLYTNEPWSVILILPPLALAHNGFENYLKLRKQARTTIELLADVVDRRDTYTASHSSRVADYAEKIATEMGLPYEQVEKLGMAGRVHDLGKVAVDDSILQKNERLSDKEFKLMRTHSETGYNILSPLDMYKDLLSYVLYHHERIDGKGYPQGLIGNHIPLGARILAVADSYDAMTSSRPYRSAMSEEEAVQELIQNSGKQFDPEIVAAFISVWEKKSRPGEK